MEALRRIKTNTVEKRLLNSKGTPNFYVNFYILNAKGEYAGVTMYQGSNAMFAICDEGGPQTLSCEALLPGKSGEIEANGIVVSEPPLKGCILLYANQQQVLLSSIL